jgi:hypothetical protein
MVQVQHLVAQAVCSGLSILKIWPVSEPSRHDSAVLMVQNAHAGSGQ